MFEEAALVRRLAVARRFAKPPREVPLITSKPPIMLHERSRWKDRGTFTTLIKTSVDKLRKGRQLEIPDERVPGLIEKIAVHLEETMEPGAEFLLQAHQPPREPKKQKPPPPDRRTLRRKAKLWKQLVARQQQARIEICVYVKGRKAPDIFFYEPISADVEFACANDAEIFI